MVTVIEAFRFILVKSYLVMENFYGRRYALSRKTTTTAAYMTLVRAIYPAETSCFSVVRRCEEWHEGVASQKRSFWQECLCKEISFRVNGI